MEFVSDGKVDIKYGTSLEKQKGKPSKKRLILKKMKKNPIISASIIMLVLLGGVNFVLIYTFMNILKSV